MPKKNITASLILILALLLTITGCGWQQQTSQNEKQSQPVPASQQRQAKKEKIWPPTTDDKIESALAAKKISREKAAFLFIQNSLEPEKVPAEFRGAKNPFGHSNLRRELQWAINNWDNLSPEAQTELKPYVAAPDEEIYFSNQKKSSRQPSLIAAARAADDWQTLSFDMLFKNSQGVYTDMTGIGQILYHQGEKSQAEEIKTAAIKSWQMFQTLLDKTLNKTTKIYYAKLGSDYGVAVWRPQKNYCEIRINKDKAIGNLLKATVAHELFHCFQYNYAPTYWQKSDSPDIDWLEEATATWAEDFVYPQFNSEQEYLEYYFSHLNNGLVNDGEGYKYGSYLWFFFLSQHLGRDGHIKAILNQASGGKIKKAIRNSTPDYSDVFSEFAVYNWNFPPAQLYQDQPSFPDYTPTEKIADYPFISKREDFDYKVNLGPGQAFYTQYLIDGDNDNGATIPKLEFDFGGPNTDPNLRRLAFVSIGNRWERQELNSVGKIEFCRRRPEERVEEVLIIYSNADLNNGQSATYKVDASGDCQVEKNGWLKIHEHSAPPFKNFNVTLTLNEVVEYNKEEDAFVVLKRKATCQSSDKSNMPGIMGQPLKSSSLGAGSLSEDYSDDENQDVRFKILTDNASGYITTTVNAHNPNWVTYTNKLSGADTYIEKRPCLGTWPERLDLKPAEIKNGRIKGSRAITQPDGVITIEFDYPLP